jgi:rubredoxin
VIGGVAFSERRKDHPDVCPECGDELMFDDDYEVGEYWYCPQCGFVRSDAV